MSNTIKNRGGCVPIAFDPGKASLRGDARINPAKPDCPLRVDFAVVVFEENITWRP
jgi:hypothetical protein